MEKLKYQVVSIDTMNSQINLRLPETLLLTAKKYAEDNGFNNIQELIKETLREKLFEKNDLTKEELYLIKNIAEISKNKNLFGTEEELFKKLKK